jgi:hypothetical protein
MLDSTASTVAAGTGLPVTLRRVLFFTLVAATMLAVLALAVVALSSGGLGMLDLLLLVLYAIALQIGRAHV